MTDLGLTAYKYNEGGEANLLRPLFCLIILSNLAKIGKNWKEF